MADIEDYLWLKLKLAKFLNGKFPENEMPSKNLVDIILNGIASQKQQSS
jgi:hypothetical protein